MKKHFYLIPTIVFFLFTSCNQTKKNNTDTNSADIIYYGGDIITMEGDAPTYAESMAIKNGKIIFIGAKKEAEQFKGDSTNMTDLKGATLLPGFIDGHSHLLTIADGTVQANLSPAPVGKVASINDIISTLKELKHSQNFSDTDMLIGWGYDQDFLKEKRHPTAAELDAAFPTNPVILMHTSSHMLVANSLAFNLAGISASTKDPR